MIYLASPYSDPIPAVRCERARMATNCAKYYLQQGVPLFSPIAYGHPLSIGTTMPTDAASWERLNIPMVAAAWRVWVLMIDGWDRSVGVAAEIEQARQKGTPLVCVMPEGENFTTFGWGTVAGGIGSTDWGTA
jgi:hypothetical protein